MVRDGQLVVPPVTDGVLESITRRSVLELYAREYGRPAVERSIDRTELYVCDEVLLLRLGGGGDAGHRRRSPESGRRHARSDHEDSPAAVLRRRARDDPAFAGSLTPVYAV